MAAHETTSTHTIAEGAHSHSPAAEHAAHAAATSEQAKELFTKGELQQFDADDDMAGGTIGKMLALFFLYTVIVMTVVAWWTAHSVKGP